MDVSTSMMSSSRIAEHATSFLLIDLSKEPVRTVNTSRRGEINASTAENFLIRLSLLSRDAKSAVLLLKSRKADTSSSICRNLNLSSKHGSAKRRRKANGLRMQSNLLKPGLKKA